MKEAKKTSTADVYPSATPSQEEIAAWNSLDRAEQLRRTRKVLREARSSGVGTYDLKEVERRAKKRLASKQSA